ncbi:MAG TPA: hypothetical protein VLF71_02260 [Candidatus Saccharimonadales bacterium]|nr:hypothetical protein [Candidatus Saccharimonadales bacterium]
MGRMPFTGKHAVRFAYAEASRAARQGDEERRRWHVGRIGYKTSERKHLPPGRKQRLRQFQRRYP